ncbi:MAG: PCRF domain-containing protein, partial [Planctomycetota bacterium]
MADIEKKMSVPDFWNDQEGAQRLMARLKAAKAVAEPYRALVRELSDEVELLEMADEKADRAHVDEIRRKGNEYQRRVDRVELETLFSGENDDKPVFLSIHAGAGGTDSCDWAEILLRMYRRWLDRN